ncbi:MAG: restriction endonuclease subunit S, partial [Actinomycetes bacterium]
PPDDPRVAGSLLTPGAFLVSRSNTRDKVGRAGMWRGEIECCAYPDLMMRFRVNDALVDADYLESYLKSPSARRHFESSASGTSDSMVKITKRAVETLPVPLPPIPEQRRIARTLTIWDAAIEKTTRLSEARRRRYAFLVEQLTAKSDLDTVRVRSIATEVSVRNSARKVALVLSVTNRNGFELPEDRFSRRLASDDLSAYKVVRRGQYAYNPSRLNVGSISRLDDWEGCVLSPMYVVFALDDTQIESDFFLHWLGSSWARGHIVRSAQGSVRDSVSFSDFGSIRVHLPTPDTQRQAVRILNLARRELVLLSELKGAYSRQRAAMVATLLSAVHDDSSARR